jgi:hypothetical protein
MRIKYFRVMDTYHITWDLPGQVECCYTCPIRATADEFLKSTLPELLDTSKYELIIDL